MTLVTAQPKTSTNVAALRDAIVARVHAMTPGELRQLATDLATVRDEAELEDWERAYLADAPAGAQVIRYGEQLIRLTTDPPEVPPYGPPLTSEYLRKVLAEADRQRERGEVTPARELLRSWKAER